DNIKHDNLEKLFLDLSNQDCFNKQIYTIFKHLNDRPHMLIALWNYGLKYTEDDLETLNQPNGLGLKSKLKSKAFLENHSAPRKRYQQLNDKCPISLQLINKPAILTDGTVYEYDCIKDHLLAKNTNPLTNEEL